jgi:hypothetical protein
VNNIAITFNENDHSDKNLISTRDKDSLRS